MRHIGLYFSLLLIFFCSCREHRQIIEFDPQELYETVMLLDSVNNDIINLSSNDVPDLINLDTGEPYNADEVDAAYAQVAKDWNRFIKLIRRHQYKKASVFIMDTDNRGSILGHLRESELRTFFILEVVKNLLLEYQEDNYFLVYLEWLYVESLSEANINGTMYGVPQNVAKTFPNLILDYGITLASAGYLDNALELVSIYDFANKYLRPDDDLFVQFEKAYFESSIYHLVDEATTADSILLDFRDNVTPEYGARGKDAAKDVDEILAYWAKQELRE